MDDPYYKQRLFLAQVDKNDNIIGEVERWRAHKEGILHRGFTAILTYKGKYLLQHRKHPAFDKYWDFTFSSHQVYENGKLESDLDAIYKALFREWNLNKPDIIQKPEKIGQVYYLAKDPNSIYTEHEIDYIYLAKINKLPHPNLDYSYTYELIDKIDKITKLSSSYMLAPWVKQIIERISFPQI